MHTNKLQLTYKRNSFVSENSCKSNTAIIIKFNSKISDKNNRK